MRKRSLGMTLFVFLAFALSAAADVGFRLAPGSVSRANTAKGYRIRLDVEPWGPTGNVPQPNFAQLAALRYGGELAADTKAPDVSGLHASDYEAALIMIATKDPEWCRSVGGSPCHPGQPTEQESHDAQYWSFGGRVIQRARELGLNEPAPTNNKIPGKLTGPDSGQPGDSLAYGVEGCDPLRPWRWSAPGAFIRGRGNAVTVTFPENRVYTVSAVGSGNCGDAAMTVTIGDIPTPPPPPPPPDPDETEPDPPPTPPAGKCEDVLKKIEPLLEQMLEAIKSSKPPAPTP